MYWLILLTVPSIAFALRPGVSVSRRLLAFALVVLVPVAGPFLAVLVRRARGGAVALEPVMEVPSRHLSPADVGRLGDQPPVVDRLLAGDAAERLAALVTLSSTADAAAIAVLRWTVEHGSSDVVLDAALTLEEIDLRSEARLDAAQAALTASVVADAGLELAAASAAEGRVLNRLADAALTSILAATARACYQRALACAPERAAEIDERFARLELAAGYPVVALEIASRIVCGDARGLVRITQLRDDAAFAARVPGLLVAIPCAPALPVARRACGEITRRVSQPRRISTVMQVREVAAAAMVI